MTPSLRSRSLGLVLPIVAAALAACSPSQNGQPGAAPPPMPVGVVTVQPEAVPLGSELTGRLEAYRTAQIRARVSGVLQRRAVEEGSLVKAGQPLFQIEPDAYRNAQAAAQAVESKASAAAALAKFAYERNKPIFDAKGLSAQEFLNIETQHKLAQADWASAKANLQTAQLNLSYASVPSPITGRIGRALVTEGALVSPTDATPLAVVQQMDPMRITFQQSATDLLALRRAISAGKLKAAGEAGLKVKVTLDDGSVYPHTAKLTLTDVSVDPASGQVTLKADVPNPDGMLLPGMVVRVHVDQAVSESAVLLPQQAVTRGSAGDTVLVLGPDSVPSPRVVKIAGARGNQWIVTDGLKKGEQVVVDGVQKIRPKTPVKPVPWMPAGASAPASASSGAPTAPAASAASR